MALYEGLNQGILPEPPPRPAARLAPDAPSAWRTVEARTRGGQARGPWLDRLLGRGSAQTVGKAVGSTLARMQAAPAVASAPPVSWAPKRMRAVGAGESAVPQGRKGLIRGLLLALALAWAAVAIKPWQKAASLKVDLGALFTRADDSEEAHREAEQRRLDAVKAQAESQRLAALPLLPGTGKPVALWQDGSAHWYKVDADGVLAATALPWAKDCLGLPELRGLAAHSEAHDAGRRLCLDLSAGLPAGLLPLDPAVAAEVRAVLLEDPTEPVLLTHDGTRCPLGPDHWGERERRLGLVLADLGARRRRAGTIDLRFEETAVVRLAGR